MCKGVHLEQEAENNLSFNHWECGW
jgi:hypothetical protein